MTKQKKGLSAAKAKYVRAEKELEKIWKLESDLKMKQFEAAEQLANELGANLFSACEALAKEVREGAVREKADELLENLRAESPLLHRLGGELEELRALSTADNS